MVGDSLGYAVGRRGGRRFLKRYGRYVGITAEKLIRADDYFARHGARTVFFGRFLGLLRILAGPLAGASRMPYRRFLAANVASAVTWATTMGTLAFFFGKPVAAFLSWLGVWALVAFLIARFALKRLCGRRAPYRPRRQAGAPQRQETKRRMRERETDASTREVGAGFMPVARADELTEGDLQAFRVLDTKIAVANVGGTFYAFDDTCTHEGCSLAEGELDETTVTCHCHGSKFDVTNGAVLEGPAQDPVETYETRQKDGNLEIKG